MKSGRWGATARLARRRLTSIRLAARQILGRAAAERGLFLLFFFCLLITLGLAGAWLAGRARGLARTAAASASSAPAGLALETGAVTPSPFLPAANTRTPLVTATPDRKAWWPALDLADNAAPLRLRLSAPQAPALAVEFRPGWPCEFDDHRACLSHHFGGQVLLITVHSGVGGEAQALRDALEGTGFNRAAFSLERITANLRALEDRPAALEQGALRLDGLRVLAALRVPPDRLEAYYTQPFDDALAEAAQASPALERALASGDPLLALETCGWRHPAEAWYPTVTDTSGAVYLLLVGR